MLFMAHLLARERERETWDVVVIGGGPAGMMAAATAAARGRSVLLLEKNPSLGKKLLITGGGRCNVTNNKPVVRNILALYGAAGKFLFSTFTQYGVQETLRFFAERGVPLHEENDGRMFPDTNTAQSIWDALKSDVDENKVVIRTKQVVSGIVPIQGDGGLSIVIKDKHSVVARAVILATGGLSRPETGSTGEGFSWLRSLGHTVRENDFALVPIALKDEWVRTLGGVSLARATLTVMADGRKQSRLTGKLLFTHFGVSGPLALNLSQTVGAVLGASTVTLELDLIPDLEVGALRIKLQSLLVGESNKKLKNILSKLIPTALVAPLLTLAHIDGETPAHSVRSVDRTALVARLKSIPLTVDYLLGADKAVVANGGVALSEINFKTMESRLVPGLYVVGDILDITRPTGGYGLQLCWSTGYVAGLNA